jgi:hypothetical protein
VSCAPFRQALIASRSVTAELGLRAGDLRENIIVDCDHLYDLPSGTVVQIGRALLRLDCEVPLHTASTLSRIVAHARRS